jgi:hypothetical protein
MRRKVASTSTGGTGLAVIGIGVSVEGALSPVLIAVGGVLVLLGVIGWVRELLRHDDALPAAKSVKPVAASLPTRDGAPPSADPQWPPSSFPPGYIDLPGPVEHVHRWAAAEPVDPDVSTAAIAATAKGSRRKTEIITGLRERAADGAALDTAEPVDEVTGLPPIEHEGDAFYEWALSTWRWLYEHFYAAASAFRGQHPGSDFERPFRAETAAVGRDAYRGRLVRLLEDLTGELESDGTPEERLGQALAEAIKLRTRLNVWDSPMHWSDELAGGKYDDRPFTNHPLYKWAHPTYRLVLDHFSDYADEFYGEKDGDPPYFALAYTTQTEPLNGGRMAYLERRIELLKRIVRDTRARESQLHQGNSLDARSDSDLLVALPSKIREGTEIMREAAVGCRESYQLLHFNQPNPLDREHLRRQERAWTEEVEGLLRRANHSDLRRFSQAFGKEADGYCGIQNRVDAKLKVLGEILDAPPAADIEPEDALAFIDFAHSFAGWFRGHEIAAPPDMTEALGPEYEHELRRDMAEGAISLEEYQRKSEPFDERRAWVQQVRKEYQQTWRANVARWVEWARRSGAMEREDFIVQVFVENPHEGDLKDLVESVERMAERLK